MAKNYFTIFNKDNLGQLSATITKDGKMFFKLSDVCRILGIKNPSDEADYLKSMSTDTKEPPVVILDAVIKTGKRKDGSTYEQMGKANFVNQTGLFLAILRSTKSEAKAFTVWVVETVLPALTEKSAYIVGEEDLSEEEQDEVHKEIAPIVAKVTNKVVKENPMKDFFTPPRYIASDGMVFSDRKSCIEYERDLRG